MVSQVGLEAPLSAQEEISRYFLDWYVEMLCHDGKPKAAFSAMNKARAQRRSEVAAQNEMAARSGPASRRSSDDDSKALITPCWLSPDPPTPSPQLPIHYLERPLLQTLLRTHLLTTPA